MISERPSDRESRRMARASRLISGIALVSRMLGYVRDMLMAWFFGAGWVADAVVTAFRLPNLVRRLFGEGSLSIAFIPEYLGVRKRHGPAAAAALARKAMGRLALWLLAITGLGLLGAPLLVKLLAAGFDPGSDKFDLTVTLTRMMLPYIPFVCLAALAMGVFHCHDRFALPVTAHVVLNLVMIGTLVGVAALTMVATRRAVGLAIGVTVGGLCQLLIHLPTLRTLIAGPTHRTAPVTADLSPALGRMARAAGPAALGASSLNLSLMVTHWMASWQSTGCLTHLYFADRLIQFPLGIFSVAVATAALPSLSRQVLEGDLAGLRETYQSGLQLVLFITLPAMVGLILLREPVVRLLFQHGAFDARAVVQTARTLLIYGAGLWAFAGIRMAVSVLNALGEARLTARVALWSVGLNLLLSLFIMRPMGYDGLVLVLMTTGVFNFVALLVAIRRRLGRLDGARLIRSLSKTTSCTLLMAGWAMLAMAWLPNLWEIFRNFPVLVLSLTIVGALLTFGVSARWLKCEEMDLFLSWRTEKKRKV